MPGATHPVDELYALSRSFGAREAARKLELLRRIAALKSLSTGRVVRLHDTLYFMRAYPDDAAVLGAVLTAVSALRDRVDAHTGGDSLHGAFANTGMPGSFNAYEYSYAVLSRLVEMFPGCLEIDWDGVADESALGETLSMTIAAVEQTGLEDEYASMREWLRDCKTSPSQTGLETVLEMFRRSTLDPRQQEHAFETCALPVTYDLGTPGSGRCEVGVTPKAVFFQKRPLARERFPLRPKIVRPLPGRRTLSPAAGRKMVDLFLAALCSRNLEIYPLMHANPADVTVVECGRGMQVVLVGVQPEFRYALESMLFFAIQKNGVPIAYGPATIFAGCCEMGINLFPEFRGGEIRYIYAQFMRTLYHVAHVRYFYVTSYGMGEGNPEALRSGAFWFYRKMGFRASDPDVETLAREEEAIMRSRPRHRSSLATLRELSYTDAYFDLSRGACRPLDMGSLGRAVSRHIAARFRGDRGRAERSCARDLVHHLEIDDFGAWEPNEKIALQRLAPLLCLSADIASWPAADRRRLARLLRAKGARSELDYTGRVARLSRLEKILRALSSGRG